MGYPIEMIDKETALFSLIGESAIESKKDSLFNNYFKADDVNAKMMPLNIRMDDIGFFIFGFKDSQIKAGYFQKEYWLRLHDILDEMSEEAKVCGIVDTIDVVEGKNIAYLSQGRATESLLNTKDKKVGIYGNTASVKSILHHLKAKEIVLYDEIVENCAELMKYIPEGISVDIERVQDSTIMIEDCDIFINALQDKDFTYHDSVQVLELTYTPRADLRTHDSKYLNFTDIEEEIAKIKTKEWMKNG